MTLKLTLLQRFKIEWLMAQHQGAPTSTESRLRWKIADAIGLTPSENQKYVVTIDPTPFNPNGSRYIKNQATESGDTEEFTLDDSLANEMIKIIDESPVMSSSERVWYSPLKAQFEKP